MVYQAEKMLKENGDKAPKEMKEEVEAGVKEAKTKLESDDVEVLKSAKTQFEGKLHKLTELIYKQTAGAQGEAGSGSGDADPRAGATGGGESSQNQKKDDNVVDAEFEESSSK